MHAVPGMRTNVPIWILGSSTFGAHLAASLGLPYAFASHFAPAALAEALDVYRSEFQPSSRLSQPYAMVGANVVVAETDQEARRLFTSIQQAFAGMIRGVRRQMQPPIDDIDDFWTNAERQQASSMLACSFVGNPQTVQRELSAFLAETGADELMVASPVYDHSARLRSFEMLSSIFLTRSREPSLSA